MAIDELTAREEELQSRMPEGGHFEHRDEYLEANGLYSEWNEIFKSYVELALSGDLEALKRALFYCWYMCAEPYQLSGLHDLDEDSTGKVLEYLNNRINANEIDEELLIMFPFYYEVADYYFERFQSSLKLDSLIEASTKKASHYQLKKFLYNNRGQLGEYWKGILKQY